MALCAVPVAQVSEAAGEPGDFILGCSGLRLALRAKPRLAGPGHPLRWVPYGIRTRIPGPACKADALPLC